jgi:hypothetical protein
MYISDIKIKTGKKKSMLQQLNSWVGAGFMQN